MVQQIDAVMYIPELQHLTEDWEKMEIERTDIGRKQVAAEIKEILQTALKEGRKPTEVESKIWEVVNNILEETTTSSQPHKKP